VVCAIAAIVVTKLVVSVLLMQVFRQVLVVRVPNKKGESSPTMSKRNCLLSQQLCRYLNQGCTLNDILMTDKR